MKCSLKPRFHIADMTLKSTSKSHLQKPIYSPYWERLCHFLSESVHIWKNDCLWYVVCLICSFLSQSIFFSQVMSGWLLLGWTGTKQDIMCLACHVFFSCSLVVTCWARADLLAPLYVMFCVYIILPHCVLGHVWNLIVSIPDLCLLLYFAQWQYAVPPVRLKPATPLSRLKHSTTGYCTRILCGDYDENFRSLLWP